MIQDFTSPLDFPQEYYYGLSLVVAGVVNIALALMLLFDSNNYIYTETPRYLRARRLTGVALIVFGIGFLLHWLFMPHFNNLLAGKALSFSYFHIGGVLFSLSHTGLIDRHYFCRRVVVRDVMVLFFSLIIYWGNAWVANQTLTYIGSALFFLHIGYLTSVFYIRFNRIYHQLGDYADYMPNDTDKEMLWLHYSCHLIIAFGIGGMACTVLFHDATKPFTILLLIGVAVFSYIYKALESFGTIASEAEGNLRDSEEYMKNKNQEEDYFMEYEYALSKSALDSLTKGTANDNIKRIVEQWVEERHYTDDTLTIHEALKQMNITEKALNYYLERHTSAHSYRQWLQQLRIDEAKRQMLLHPDYSLQAIAKLCGYSSNSSLTRSFRLNESISPIEWVEKNNSFEKNEKK